MEQSAGWQSFNTNGHSSKLLNVPSNKHQLAIEFHQQSLEVDREIGDRHDEANSLFNPAQVIRAPQVRDESDTPTRPRKRRKTPWWVWGLVGVSIVLAIAWWFKK